MLLYWIRKLLSVLLSPLVASCVLLIAGAALLWSGRRPPWARALISAGIVLLVASGYGLPGRLVVAHLENRHAPLQVEQLAAKQRSRIRFIAVLGSGHVSDPRLPSTARIDRHSLYRLVEAIRIHRQLPATRLVLSGGGGYDPVPNARIVAEVAAVLGIDRQQMVLEPAPSNTAQEARALQPLLGTAPFILVTSAAHLPRAMGVFTRLGMHPIPAPTEFRIKRTGDADRSPARLFPTAKNLELTRTALYETVGMLWYRLRGHMGPGQGSVEK